MLFCFQQIPTPLFWREEWERQGHSETVVGMKSTMKGDCQILTVERQVYVLNNKSFSVFVSSCHVEGIFRSKQGHSPQLV